MLVDDDPFILAGIGKNLQNEGYRVTTTESGEKAVVLLKKKVFDLVITDLVMEGLDGIQVLKKAKELHSETMVIILTGCGDLMSAIDGIRLDADDYLLKPCEPEEMRFRVSSCLEKLDLRRKIKLYEDILPVCCICKKVRDDGGKKPGTGQWMSIERYIHDKANVDVTSTYCPGCAQKVKEEINCCNIQ